MCQYRYTDKLLVILAISNILMLIPFIWLQMFLIKLFLIAKHNGYTIPLAINTFSPIVEWAVVAGITAWSFFKRIRWVVIPYMLYISHWFTLNYLSFLEFLKSAFFGEEPNVGGIPIVGDFLASKVYTYFYMFLWLLGLITVVVMLLETDYRDLYYRWRKLFIG